MRGSLLSLLQLIIIVLLSGIVLAIVSMEVEDDTSPGVIRLAKAQVNVSPDVNDSTNQELSGLEETDSGIPAPAAGLRFNAQDIAQTNTLKLDSDIKNLVIMIPDKRLVEQNFIPLDATIVEGTKIIWSNGDQGTVHGISVQDAAGGILFSNETIPYKNSTEYTFDTQGTFVFSDPQVPTSIKGSINVIDPSNAPDNLSTNSTQATAGLFVAPAPDKAYWDNHFNRLGYHVEDTYAIEGPQGNDMQLYVYTQKSGKYPTLVDRTSVKIDIIGSKLS